MKAVVQRVKNTRLFVDGQLISEIPFGLTVFFGVKVGDTEKQADYIAKKIAGLRIFEDENGKMNLSVKDVGGEVLFDRYIPRIPQNTDDQLLSYQT